MNVKMSLIQEINDCSETGLIRIAGSIMKEGVLAKEADAGWPMGLAQRKTGELIIADYIFNIIWEIDSDGVLHRLAGTGMPGYSGDGGLAVDAELSGCHDLIIDNNGDNASQVIYDSVQNFSDLPAEGIDGQVVEVKGDAANNFDNYWVKWVASTSVWEETIAPSITYKFDYDTMPHLLIRTADGNFRLTQADGSSYTISATSYDVPEWGERLVGDLDSAPNPSFVDTTIKDIFFHSNRLGLLADENVVLSRASEYLDDTATITWEAKTFTEEEANEEFSLAYQGNPYQPMTLVVNAAIYNELSLSDN